MARKKPSARTQKAWTVAFAALFETVLTEIVTNDENAAAYREFHAAARDLTKQQQKRVAEYMSEYYVPRAGPNPGRLSEDRVHQLMREAVANALQRLANENPPQEENG